MTLFDKCYDLLLKNEGGYSYHPKDKGGETYKGIARRYHSSWKGWDILDDYKFGRDFPVNAYQDDELDELVRSFYRDIFWDRMKLDLISNENAALQIFDMAVNSGIRTAVKIAQRVCLSKVDGVLGARTAIKINQMGDAFVDKYILARIEKYRDIVNNDPSQQVFLNGWIRRARETKF